MGKGVRRNGVDRVFRVTGFKRQHFESIPGEHLLRPSQAWFTPIWIDLRRVFPTINHKVVHCIAHRVGNTLRAPFGHVKLARGRGQAGNGVGENDARVGQ